MRRALCLLLLLAASGAHAEGFWPSLWRTADQRGEQLLRQGDAAAAARTYADPRRRAYAEFKAGDYAAAADDFAAFDDSDAHYNRGNALAHVGDLAAALKAYDNALARDPNNRDARHNRDLVAQALQQQPPPQPPPPKQQGGQGQSGKQEGKQGDKQGDKQGNSAGQSGGQGQGTPGKSASDQAGKSGQHQRDGKSGDQGRGGGENRQSQPSGNDAEQARRDAEASLGREAGRNAAEKNATTGQGETAGSADQRGQGEAPRGEQQLAREQWLRQIPDDPGGLLRRKFMIEHLMRQQGNQR